jgi:hypothetical protein
VIVTTKKTIEEPAVRRVTVGQHQETTALAEAAEEQPAVVASLLVAPVEWESREQATNVRAEPHEDHHVDPLAPKEAAAENSLAVPAEWAWAEFQTREAHEGDPVDQAATREAPTTATMTSEVLLTTTKTKTAFSNVVKHLQNCERSFAEWMPMAIRKSTKMSTTITLTTSSR